MHRELTNERMLLSKTRNRWPGVSASLLLGCLLFIASLRCEAQNLVPNGSFEQIDSCPVYPALTGFQPGAIPDQWFSASETPDYFNACVDTVTSLPSNMVGYQQAFNGQAYAGMWSFLWDDSREMIGAQLVSPLSIGETYYASFYVNAAYGGQQPIDIGCGNTGLLFTMDPYFWVTYMPEYGLRNYAQVYSANVITDTLGWTLVSGSFVADSAYRYLIVGNHFDNVHTDTAYIGPSPWDIYYGWAYTLVDQICVSPDPEGCPMATGMIEVSGANGGVFPNPVKDELHAYFGEKLAGEIRVVDVLGRTVWIGSAAGKDQLDLPVADWAKGQYVLNGIGKGGRRSFKFVIVE
ncbi:MAG: T9SS type A sorting domain-containing protein [Flavobacteriales bacterium]